MSLQDLTEGDDLDVTLEDPPPSIDENLAVRLLARRRHRLAEQAAFDEAWNTMLEPLLLHREQVTERNRREVERIETLLGQMLEARRADDPKLTKLDLPGGTLKSRAQQPEWTYDADTFIAWAMENHQDGLVRERLEVDKRTAKAELHPATEGRPGEVVPVITNDGEIIPGVTVTYRPRKLVIES